MVAKWYKPAWWKFPVKATAACWSTRFLVIYVVCIIAVGRCYSREVVVVVVLAVAVGAVLFLVGSSMAGVVLVALSWLDSAIQLVSTGKI